MIILLGILLLIAWVLICWALIKDRDIPTIICAILYIIPTFIFICYIKGMI
jgi:hypothetical protein